MHLRHATPSDSAAIASIYNEGIADRIATFETRPRSAEDIGAWFDGHPIVVAEEDHRIVGFGATSTYRPRTCYAGIAEVSVYVARGARGHGVGKEVLRTLMDVARDAGFWKLVSRAFPDNLASRAMLRHLGFREVGVYEKHGQLDGVWRDVVIVERLLESAAA